MSVRPGPCSIEDCPNQRARRRWCDTHYKRWLKHGDPLTVRGSSAEENPQWKGDDVGYEALHAWVKKHKRHASACEHCGALDRLLDWANRSHEYRRDLDDWMSLCRSCHALYDAPKACPQGHPFDAENTYRSPRGQRYCRTCHRETARLARLRKQAA